VFDFHGGVRDRFAWCSVDTWWQFTPPPSGGSALHSPKLVSCIHAAKPPIEPKLSPRHRTRVPVLILACCPWGLFALQADEIRAVASNFRQALAAAGRFRTTPAIRSADTRLHWQALRADPQRRAV
jgi:hypothetical protein